jgi:hypothetical protein
MTLPCAFECSFPRSPRKCHEHASKCSAQNIPGSIWKIRNRCDGWSKTPSSFLRSVHSKFLPPRSCHPDPAHRRRLVIFPEHTSPKIRRISIPITQRISLLPSLTESVRYDTYGSALILCTSMCTSGFFASFRLDALQKRSQSGRIEFACAEIPQRGPIQVPGYAANARTAEKGRIVSRS